MIDRPLYLLPFRSSGVAADFLGLDGDAWTALGVILGFVGVMTGLFLTWRGQRREERRFEVTATRAERAQAAAADDTERIVDALNALAAAFRGVGTPPPIGVRWKISATTGSGYRLENIGDRPADEVAITSDPTLHLIGLPSTPVRLEPGEALSFVEAASLATRDMTVTVTWNDEDATRQWRYPLV